MGQEGNVSESVDTSKTRQYITYYYIFHQILETIVFHTLH